MRPRSSGSVSAFDRGGCHGPHHSEKRCAGTARGAVWTFSAHTDDADREARHRTERQARHHEPISPGTRTRGERASCNDRSETKLQEFK